MDYLDLPFGVFLSELAAARPAPSGGGAAAAAVALGASLCAMTTRLSARQLTPQTAAGLTADAERLGARAASLIQADADAYQRVLAERRQAASTSGAARDRQRRIEQALSEATCVPMDIIKLAARVARLAARLAADGNPSLRGDAIAAAELAAAGGRAAAVLVRINLAGAPGDGRHAASERMLAEIARSLAAGQAAGPRAPAS